MKISICAVTEEDRPVFEQLYTDYLEEVEPNNSQVPKGWIDNAFAQALANQRCLWIVKNGDEIIGFVDVKVNPFFPNSDDKYAMIHDFYIVPTYRRHGLGRELVRLIVSEAQRQGAKSVELNVSPHNPNAMKFWQSAGFKLRQYALEMDISEA